MTLWNRVRGAVIATWHRMRNRLAFRRAVLAAASDGRLTHDEATKLDVLRDELGIGREAANQIGVDAYVAAYRAAAADGRITREEETELQRIQEYFNVADRSISRTKRDLARFRLLRQIGEGDLPTFAVSGLGLQKHEQPHWVEPARLLEERVVRREYVGSSSGVSVRIAKGITYRVGAQRGRMVTTTGIVAVSSGELVITNKRVLFRGDKKGFSTRLDKLLDAEVFADGIRLMEGSGKPRLLQLQSTQNIDIFGAILSRVIANTNA